MITPPIPLAEIEQRHIEQTVARCKGNKTAAARMLGISDRTVRHKMALYDRQPPLEPLHACPFCTSETHAA